MRSTVKSLDTWVENNPNKARIPRMIGEHDFTIGDMTEKRAIGSFHQYKLQRIIDCYQQFTAQDKQSVDSFLESVGGLDSMQLVFKNRLSRVNNQLILSV